MPLRVSLLAIISLALTAGASATTLKVADVLDAYGGSNNSGSNNGDVNGSLALFDINQIKFLQLDSTMATIEIDLNYDGGNTALPQFSVGSDQLNIGDLMFGTNNAALTAFSPTWGVALQSHKYSPNAASDYSYAPPTGAIYSVAAGALYQINAGGAITAYDVLKNPATGNYNYAEDVWMWADGDPSVSGNTLTLAKNPLANPVSTAVMDHNELAVKISFATTQTFLNAIAGGNLYVHFAAATCANDVLDGKLQLVPEPGTWSMLLGGGLIGLGLWRRRSMRS